MRKTNVAKPPLCGFTLMELSIVILVLSLMLGGIMTVVNQQVRQEKLAELRHRFDVINNAILTYRRVYDRIPCPSNLALKISNTNFGLEGQDPANCVDNTPNATFSSGNVAAGGVPFRTLGLDDRYAFDPWGNRLLYAVDIRVTDSTTNRPFRVYPPDSTTIGAITIQDDEGDTVTSNAVYLLLSHGANGHGAYNNSGSARKANGSTNADELENCDCNDKATDTGFDGVFSLVPHSFSTSALNQYDDYAVYFMRADLLNAQEEANLLP